MSSAEHPFLDSLERIWRKATRSDQGFARHGSDFSGAEQSAVIVLDALRDWAQFESVLDVGCGAGHWATVAASLGLEVVGVDGPHLESEQFRFPFVAHDLTEPLDLGRRFDLVVSMEVAEHLPESAADTFVDSLTRHAPLVLFSAAIPGQRGRRHVNEQWPEYWADKFGRRGYDAYDIIRPRVWREESVLWWYAQNAVVYSSMPIAGAAATTPQSLIHPELWDKALSPGLGRFLAACSSGARRVWRGRR